MRSALARQNADVPGGNVKPDREELVLRTMGRYTDPREFEDLVIANINGSPIRLRDIGRVEDGTKEQRSHRAAQWRAHGHPRNSPPVRRKHDRSHQRHQSANCRELPANCRPM